MMLERISIVYCFYYFYSFNFRFLLSFQQSLFVSYFYLFCSLEQFVLYLQARLHKKLSGKMAARLLGRKTHTQKKKKALTFTIDCSRPVDDKIMEIASFEKFLTDNIKIEGKKGMLGEQVKVSREKAKVVVSSDIAMSKRYLKYLTKKYLKKHNVRDWLRVIASNKDRSAYELRYFNIATDQGEEEEE
eukprot:TRINITY_DN356_c0_g1_i7.p2 TRINITY_DN356_c0_g1~~TRINITY_DN356_c0_g1_i7.p2  ORF type:complete len:188 (-),score=19.57 TRINITY_DN356_c0_g1_i7:226-789(-)